MDLKYEAELHQRPDQPCPCVTHFTQRSLVAFRFMRREATDADFLPVAKIDGVKPTDKCSRFALSFFVTFEQAAARYTDLAERIGKEFAAGRYGDHAGRISLHETDGVCSQADDFGHFNLHEAADVDWSGRVEEYFKLGSEPHDAP